MSFLLGLVLGVVATSIFLAGTWFAVRVVGQAARPEGLKGPLPLGWLVMIGLKLPLLLGLGWLAQQVGGEVMTGFLVGLGAVYLLLVGWGLLQGSRTSD